MMSADDYDEFIKQENKFYEIKTDYSKLFYQVPF